MFYRRHRLFRSRRGLLGEAGALEGCFAAHVWSQAEQTAAGDRLPVGAELLDDRVHVGHRAAAPRQPRERQGALPLAAVLAGREVGAREQRHRVGARRQHRPGRRLPDRHPVQRHRRPSLRGQERVRRAAPRRPAGRGHRRAVHRQPHPGARQHAERLPLHDPLGESRQLLARTSRRSRRPPNCSRSTATASPAPAAPRRST